MEFLKDSPDDRDLGSEPTDWHPFYVNFLIILRIKYYFNFQLYFNLNLRIHFEDRLPENRRARAENMHVDSG